MAIFRLYLPGTTATREREAPEAAALPGRVFVAAVSWAKAQGLSGRVQRAGRYPYGAASRAATDLPGRPNRSGLKALPPGAARLGTQPSVHTDLQRLFDKLGVHRRAGRVSVKTASAPFQTSAISYQIRSNSTRKTLQRRYAADRPRAAVCPPWLWPWPPKTGAGRVNGALPDATLRIKTLRQALTAG